jgi:hypothetical protein
VIGETDHSKPRRHNAKRCRFAKRQAIIYALANHESVESIRRNYRASRHTVLAIREQYLDEIHEAQQHIKSLMEERCIRLASEALDKIGRLIPGERSVLKLLKICDKLTDKAQALDTPVQTHNPYPLSIKFAAMRRAKRNGLSVPDRSMWHEAKT